eukprot:m.700617 g.700617  ORF g.700617 m.700617 type:complete len:188 (+) comp58707_c0_seq4:74-637(+)
MVDSKCSCTAMRPTLWIRSAWPSSTLLATNWLAASSWTRRWCSATATTRSTLFLSSPHSSSIRLGAVGLTTMGWLTVMDSANKFRSSIHAFLRYEELVVQKEKLAIALLKHCGLADRVAVHDDAKMSEIFSSDAHGESATTSSKRFVTGSGRLYVSAEDLPMIEALIAKHPVVNTGDYIFPGTLGRS